MATGEGAGLEEQIAAIIRDADERFDADLSSDIVEQSVESEKVVPINPFGDPEPDQMTADGLGIRGFIVILDSPATTRCWRTGVVAWPDRAPGVTAQVST